MAACAEPGSRYFLTSDLIDPEADYGYGPAHVTAADEVKALSAQLNDFDEAGLAARFDGADMDAKGIYPGFWSEDSSMFEYLYHHFIALRDFYAEAARDGDAVVSVIS